jgi:DNA-binding MurR/RpiR family transcriptional regulator
LTDTLSGVLAGQVTVVLVASRGDAATFKSLTTAGVLLDILVFGMAARERRRSLRALENFGRLRSHIIRQDATAGPHAPD